MEKSIKIGISTCPNDTFIFGAAIRGDSKHGFKLQGIMDDVQLLNSLAIKGALDVVKVSFGVYPKISSNYKILKCGGALGFGCGPLLLSKNISDIKDLKGKRIAIPGPDTTAFMIFKLFYPEYTNDIIVLRFDEIMPAIANGECDAGLVIHEGRFTYSEYGLKKLLDLGELWEERYKSPIPLGFIAIKKTIENEANDINEMIKKSLDFAYENEKVAYEYCKKYARYMDIPVMRSHVGLYVNKFSYDLTPASEAISLLLGADSSVFA